MDPSVDFCIDDARLNHSVYFKAALRHLMLKSDLISNSTRIITLNQFLSENPIIFSLPFSVEVIDHKILCDSLKKKMSKTKDVFCKGCSATFAPFTGRFQVNRSFLQTIV